MVRKKNKDWDSIDTSELRVEILEDIKNIVKDIVDLWEIEPNFKLEKSYLEKNERNDINKIANVGISLYFDNFYDEEGSPFNAYDELYDFVDSFIYDNPKYNYVNFDEILDYAESMFKDLFKHALWQAYKNMT